METIVETRELSKWYGRNRGIVNVSLEILKGEVFGFLGPNGAGKTTTMRILLGLLRPSSGEARIAGFNCWSQAKRVKHLLGYLPAEFSFDGSQKGSQILAYLANLRGGVDKQYVSSLIERFEFDPHKKFREYSRGNKQKIGIIQAFMHRPQLLILDEPTGGLDPLNQQVFYQLVAETRANGQTIFHSSHILPEVEQTCDRVGIIREGSLVTVGPVTELKGMKQHKVTLLFPGPIDPGLFKHVEGVLSADQGENERTISLYVRGDLQQVIRLASEHQALNITSHEPSLEEIFLNYYEQKPVDIAQAQEKGK